jgi:beta-barrel assembly-enhancing protease
MTMRCSLVLAVAVVVGTAPAPAAEAGVRAPQMKAQGASATPAAPAEVVRLDRASVFDRLLAPREAGPTPGAPANKAKSLAEGADAYTRGLVFVQQGAWKEAEQALRTAEKRDGDNLEYQLSTAFVYLKLHRPDDAMNRYQRIYKKDPGHLRALVGMAATYDELQHYRDEVGAWMRYVKMDLPAAQREEGQRMLRSAQDLFVERWEIEENPRGGAANLLSPSDELELGLQEVKRLASSGMPLLQDPVIQGYLENLCQNLVDHAPGFPPKYELLVLNSTDIQASTVPGFIFVYRGLLEVVDDEAELAGVLAHEIGHSVAHHVAKQFTKAIADQKSAEAWQNQNSKFAKAMAWVVKTGSPYGQLAFSREEEAQADRLAVHITYDAGYDPLGLAEMFQRFEAMAPSSRKRWDLATRTHPFSIDRVNATKEYFAFFPWRSPGKSSPEFARMKARVAALPPPPEPKPAAAAGSAAPTPGGVPTTGAVRDYTLDNAPFAGEMPADWAARKTESGTIVFEGAKGTDAYEITVELQVIPGAELKGRSINDLGEAVRQAIARKPAGQAGALEPHQEGSLRGVVVRGTYNGKTVGGTPSLMRQISIALEYPSWFAILNYYGPEQYFNQFLPSFRQMADAFRYTGR